MIDVTKEFIVEKFKEKILDMHNGVPQQGYYGYLEDLIPSKEIRDYFLKKDVFVKSKQKRKGQDMYYLGVNGIILANNYKMEKLTHQIWHLTVMVIALTAVGIIVPLWKQEVLSPQVTFWLGVGIIIIVLLASGPYFKEVLQTARKNICSFFCIQQT